jgi:hypothetical protein
MSDSEVFYSIKGFGIAFWYVAIAAMELIISQEDDSEERKFHQITVRV